MRASSKTRANLTALLYRLRTEADTPVLQSLSIAVGVAIGCLPVYGLHLPLCFAVGRVLGLNRVTMALAANVNNPFVGPLLVLAEIQTGSLLLRGRAWDLTLENLRDYSFRDGLVDIVVGSLVVGLALGVLFGALALLVLRQNAHDRARKLLVEHAAHRFLAAGYLRWERVRVRLRRDPVYLELATSGVLPREGLLVDVGCRDGALLALLDTYRGDQDVRAVRPASWHEAPRLGLLGLEERRRDAAVARLVLAGAARVRRAEVRSVELPEASAVVMLDVLDDLEQEDQDAVLTRAGEALGRRGVLVVRVLSGARPWHGRLWRMLGRGGWRRARTADQWCSVLSRLGYSCNRRPSKRGTALVCTRSTDEVHWREQGMNGSAGDDP